MLGKKFIDKADNMKKHEMKDMTQKPEKLKTPPPEICDILDGKGIAPDRIKAFFKADMGASLEFADSWTVLTDDEVAVLEVLGGIFEKERAIK
jgi:hypothetical protein